MRVVVTGATGFLGKRIVKRLLARGDDVVAIGRNLTEGAHMSTEGARFVAVDLEQEIDRAVMNEIKTADGVIHAAALSSVWGAKQAFISANVTATRRILELAAEIGAGRFVFVSSPAVTYRPCDQIGVREDDPLPTRFINAYAASKAMAEELVRAQSDMATVILRPRAIYGRGDVALLPRLIRAAESGPLPRLRGGRACTNLTYVDDVARACLQALDRAGDVSARVFNIAGAEELPIADIVTRVCTRLNIPVRWRSVPFALAQTATAMMELKARLTPRSPEPRVTQYGLGIFAFTQTLDISAAQEALGFTPRVSFDAGLALTLGDA